METNSLIYASKMEGIKPPLPHEVVGEGWGEGGQNQNNDILF